MALAALLPAAFGAAQRDFEAALAAFPDQQLPELLQQLQDSATAAAAAKALAAIGPPAHEALLGLLLSWSGQRPPDLAQAFGGFDARCGWALPLLLRDPRRLADPLLQELLCRLGPAAAPACETLRRLAAQPSHPAGIAELLERLQSATDAPMPAAPPKATPPAVPPALRPLLLARLASGPQRWPALQALLQLGDDAAVAAAFELLVLQQQEPSAAEPRALRGVLACIYATRCLTGFQPLRDLDDAQLPVEVPRLVLARARLYEGDALRCLSIPEPQLRSVVLLADAEQRTFHGPRSYNWQRAIAPLADDPDAAVRQAFARAQVARRAAGAAEARAALTVLASGDPGLRGSVRERLASADLTDAPPELAATALQMVADGDPSSEQLAGMVLGGMPAAAAKLAAELLPAAAPAQRRVLLRALAASSTQSEAVTSALLRVGPPPEPQLQEEFCRALGAAAPATLAACADPLLADPESRIATLRSLGAIRHRGKVDQALPALAGRFAAVLPELPAAAQVDLLELDQRSPVPTAIWRALLQQPDAALRRRAVLAWGRSRRHDRPAEPELLLPLLDDADTTTRSWAVHLLGGADQRQDEIVAALAAHYAGAEGQVCGAIGQALVQLADHAGPAVAVLERALADADAERRLPAAFALLCLRGGHAAALQVIERGLDDRDPAVRSQTLRWCGNDPRLAARMLDRALAMMQDRDDDVVSSAVRLCWALPDASERWLPAVRQVAGRRGDNGSSQRARSLLQRQQRRANDAGR